MEDTYGKKNLISWEIVSHCFFDVLTANYIPQAIAISSNTINHTIHKAIVHFFNSANSLTVIKFLSQIYILQHYPIMPLNDYKYFPNLSYDRDISADYMNSLFDIPQTGNNNLDDSLFDSCSQYINTSNQWRLQLFMATRTRHWQCRKRLQKQ